MKALISSQSEKAIIAYAAFLDEAGIYYEKGMDEPHHPTDYLLSVREEDYDKAMKVFYPTRDTPTVGGAGIFP